MYTMDSSKKKGGLSEVAAPITSTTVNPYIPSKPATVYEINTQVYDNLSVAQRFLLTLTFMDCLNSLPITEETKAITIEKLKTKPISELKNNAQRLIDIGILPPIEDDIVGGEDERPVRQAVIDAKRKRDEEAAQAEANKRIKLEKAEEKRQKLIERTRFRQAVKATRYGVSDILDILQTKNAEYKNLPEAGKVITESICTPKMASKFMEVLFPENAIKEWCSKKTPEEGVKKERGCVARKIWEHIGPQQQCNAVIGEFQNQTCYICGFEIIKGNDSLDGLYPECEHILPIIQAMFFLDLYRPTDKKLLNQGQIQQEEYEEIRNTLEEEYAWSHRVCNQVKGDKYTFLQTKIDTQTNYPTWDFSENYTKQLLIAISKTNNFKTKYTANSVQNRIATYGRSWVKDRVESIRETMRPIIERIQSRGNGGFVAIIGLRNCMNIYKLNASLRSVLGDYGYSPDKLISTSPGSQNYWTELFRWFGFFKGGNRSLNIMRAGEKKQRKLTEYGFSLKKSLSQRDAANAKRNLTRKVKIEVDDLADIFGKMTTTEKKDKRGGRKTRRKSRVR
jgi:hypothetical protein